jgi:hypothetical protein
VGVLSIALERKDAALTSDAVLAFNARLRHKPPRLASQIRLDHPSDDAARWEKIPQVQRAKIAPAPAPDASLAQRLGAPGGGYTLYELTDYLLSPLKSLGLLEVQRRFSIYSVVRGDHERVRANPRARADLGALLTALTQMKEPHHAPTLPEDVAVSSIALDQSHWVSVGHSAAVHIVADQPIPAGLNSLPFNDQRVNHANLKYFIAYLLGLFQRLAIHRALDDAGDIIRDPSVDTRLGVATLRDHVLRLSVGGYFTQVSTHDGLHRFYTLAREALDVATAWSNVRQTIAELDAKSAAEHNLKLAASTARNLQVLVKTQGAVEIIEIFLVSVYAAHLFHMAVEHVKSHAWEWVHNPLMVVGVGILAGIIAALIIKPWQHGNHAEH